MEVTWHRHHPIQSVYTQKWAKIQPLWILKLVSLQLTCIVVIPTSKSTTMAKILIRIQHTIWVLTQAPILLSKNLQWKDFHAMHVIKYLQAETNCLCTSGPIGKNWKFNRNLPMIPPVQESHWMKLAPHLRIKKSQLRVMAVCSFAPLVAVDFALKWLWPATCVTMQRNVHIPALIVTKPSPVAGWGALSCVTNADMVQELNLFPNLAGRYKITFVFFTLEIELYLTKMSFIWRCDRCGKCFKDARLLRDHTRSHTGERPFACQVCGKTFAQSGTLYRHKQVHSDSRPYRCTQCNKSYKLKGHLTVHVKSHTM